jgi:hypothetical protein
MALNVGAVDADVNAKQINFSDGTIQVSAAIVPLTVGNGSGSVAMHAPSSVIPTGPTNSNIVIGFVKVIINGTVYWMPLMQ